MSESFISEPIEPEAGGFDPAAMVAGLASMPAAFSWRGRRYVIVECLEHWKESVAENYTRGGERYLRRQRFRVRLDSRQIAEIYIERHAPRGASAARRRQRWFLYTIEDVEPEGTDEHAE